ncbi:DUF5131 family protein [Fibrella sp. ES10-3-2-2]|nr:hypothetical protein A6C57_01295 [Fibrella sp. ES10-3-2-2]
MAENSKIEWTHHTANLWWGCTHVSPGCDNCYAEAWAKRYQPTALWGAETPRMAIKGVWLDLDTYQRKAAAAGEVQRVFVGSMMDIAEKEMKLITRTGEWATEDGKHLSTHYLRLRFFNQVVPASPNLQFLLLSKRPSNFNRFIPDAWHSTPPANVMFGASVVDQPTFETTYKQLLTVKGKRFLSIEPQLGPIRSVDLTGIDWVIQGGESGPRKRPFNTDWARWMRDMCAAQGVPYFFKQVDKVQEIPDDLRIRQFPV